MEDTQQGQVQTQPSAIPQGQGGADAGSATGLSAEVIQKYGAEPSADPSAVQGQGGDQGQVQANTAQPDQLRNLQSIADQRQALYLAEKQRNDALMQQMQQSLTQQQQNNQPRNPYDPNQQGAEWWKWEMNSAADRAANKAAEESEKRSQRQFESLITNAYENSWAQAHPNVNIGDVKAFADSEGLIGPKRLDNAFKLMTIPQTMNQVAQTTAQNALNQFRQPTNNGAIPLRGGGQAPQTPQLSYAKLADDYVKTNGKAYDSWPKAMQEAFDRETNARNPVHTRG